jgi:hypothetical protein
MQAFIRVVELVYRVYISTLRIFSEIFNAVKDDRELGLVPLTLPCKDHYFLNLNIKMPVLPVLPQP